MPRYNSSRGKERLGGISKMRDRFLRYELCGMPRQMRTAERLPAVAPTAVEALAETVMTRCPSLGQRCRLPDYGTLHSDSGTTFWQVGLEI
jgi:hypothetical protein